MIKINNEKKSHYNLTIGMILAIVLGLLADKFNISFLEYLGVVLTVLLVIDKEEEYFAYAIAFLLCAGEVLTLFGVSITTLLTVICVLKEIFVYKRGIRIRMLRSILMLVALGGWFAWQFDFESFFEIAKLILCLYGIQCCFINVTDLETHTKRILRYLLFGAGTTVVFSITINPYMMLGMRWAISENTGVNNTAILLGLVFSAYVILLGISKKADLPETLFLLICMGACILTGSRMGIILLVNAFAWVAIIVFISGNVVRKRYFFILICVIALSCILLIFLNPVIQKTIVYAINKTILPKDGDVSNGRFEIWKEYIYAWETDIKWILFGAGSYKNMGMKVMAHNMLIEQLTSFGIIGNLLFVKIYYDVYANIKNAWKKENNRKTIRLSGLVLIINIFISGITSHSFIGLNYTFIFYVGIMLMWYCGKQPQNNVEEIC